MAYNFETTQGLFQKIQELSGMEAKELLAALATNETASISNDYRSVRDAVEDAMATLETRRTFDSHGALESLFYDDSIEPATLAIPSTPSTPPKSREIKWCVFCKKSYCEVAMIPGDCKYHPGLEKHLVHERYIRWSCCGRQFGEEGCKSRNHTDDARKQ